MANQTFKLKSGLTLTPVDLTTLTNPQAGDLACDINDSNKIKRYDNVSTSWKEVGSGGADNVNSLLIQSFDQASLADFTQTGLTLITSNTLNGEQSARLIHDVPVTGVVRSFKQAISVDRKFRGQLMQLSLSIQSTAPQGDVTLNVYDETNATNIVASEQLTTGSQAISGLSTSSGSPTISGFTNSNINSIVVGERITGSGIPTGSIITAINSTALTVTISQNASASASGLTLNVSDAVAKRVVSFTIPASCASLSYTVSAIQEAGSPETYIDDVVIELASTALLSTSVTTPNVTAWQGYTPTFQGFGVPTNVECEWRQNGENVEIRAKFTPGTVTVVEARVGLPAGLTSANTSIIPSIQNVGIATFGYTASGNTHVLIEPNVNYVTFGYETASTGGLVKTTANNIGSNAGALSFFASVPCAGLSATTTKTIPLTQSGLVQEADSTLRMSNATVSGNVISFSNIVESIGSDVSYSSGAYTIQTSGVYSIGGIVQMAGVDNRLFITKNSTTTNFADSAVLSWGSTHNTGGYEAKAFWTGYLVAGDIIRFTSGNVLSVSSSIQKMFITKQGSLKQLNVSSDQKITIPTSELRMEGASSRGSTDTAIVRFDNVAKLRGDAFTVESDAVLGTRITMKKAGRLSVSATLLINAGSLQITRNQQTRTAGSSVASEIIAQSGSTTNVLLTASAQVDMNVGDVIRIAATVVPASNAANSLNLSFQEQEIAVAVSNTLPQFSESDLVVRAAGNAGQSITGGTTNIPFQTSFDSTGGAWNGSQFTVPESGLYDLSGTIAFTAINPGNKIRLYVDGAIYKVIASDDTSTNVFHFKIQDQFSKGQVLSIRSQDSKVLLNDSTFHWINITKVGKPNVTGVNVTPFVNVPQPVTSLLRFDGSVGKGSTDTTIVKFTTKTQSIGDAFNVTDTAANGTYVTMLKAGKLAVSCTISGSQTPLHISKNQAVLTSNPTSTEQLAATLTAVASNPATVSWEGDVQVGDKIRIATAATITAGYVTFSFTGNSDQILTAPETFSTDTASLQYASSSQYTLSTLANAPVGTYITFTYAANTNTRTQTTGTNRPSQTDADMNANGIQVFARAFNATSSAAQPAAIAIQIGKGHKGLSRNLYKSVGKVTAGTTDLFFPSTSLMYGAQVDYNENTGILVIDAAFIPGGSANTHAFVFTDSSDQTSGYLVINASKNPALTGLNIERVAARGVNSSGSIFGSAGAVVTYDSAKTFDTHNALNASTGVFTAPESGYYQIDASFNFVSATYTGGSEIYVVGAKNGIDYTLATSPIYSAYTGFAGVQMSDKVYLAKDETFRLSLFNTRGNTALRNAGLLNFFSISKVNVGGK